MHKKAVIFLIAAVSAFSQSARVAKESPGSTVVPRFSDDARPPRHLLGPGASLTAASGESPQVIALRFLRGVAGNYGLTAEDLSSIGLVREYRSVHNGVTHLTYRQGFGGVDVYGASYRINVDRDGRVLNAGGDLLRRPTSAPPTLESGTKAIRAAAREINPKVDGPYLVSAPARGEKLAKFARGGFADETEGKPVWFNVRGKLSAAWVFYLPGENGQDRYAAVVDATTQRLLRKVNLTRYQRAQGLVFERESPQPSPTPGIRSETRPLVQRTLQSFEGTPTASPEGWVSGTQTVGNNVVAGSNIAGRIQLPNPVPATAPDRNFSFPLELGPGVPSVTNYTDAATVNLFYWANVAHDRFYAFGFDESAGNFQTNNFGRGGVGGDALLAYSHFGIAAPSAAQLDNANFRTNRDFEDGSTSSINMFLFTSDDFFTDGSLDAGVIVHEYTHGVTNRLAEGVYDVYQGQAMGEAWSDYFGLEFTTPAGAPANGTYPVGEYAVQSFGTGIRSRPYSTDMSVNALTFANMGRVVRYGPEVHADGEIWMQALWEARAALVAQFGEAEGRRRMSQLVIDGLKMSPPQPSMIDARDAILLADRVDFEGQSQNQLWSAFAKRGFGVVAYSATANSVAVTPSFDSPSNTGVLRFEWDRYSLGELIRVILHDANSRSETLLVQLTASSGDVENLVLRKRGEAWYGEIAMAADGASVRFDSYLDAVTGDYISAYYVDAETGQGQKLIETTAPVTPGYSLTTLSNSAIVSGRETIVFTAGTGRYSPVTPSIQEIPFPFRFYGQEYRVMYVYGDGYITFDHPISSYNSCNSAEAASEFPTIAPLWVQLAYGGTAQANENVYISRAADSVTVRWAAETIDSGEAVNFSVVLYANGRILFQYGTGNYDLVNSSNYGCGSNAALVGLSNGHGTFIQTVPGYSGTAVLDRYPSVALDPPYNNSSIPVVQLESPVANGTYAGVLTVRGIAYDKDDSVARLDILLDGVPRRLIRPTLSRTDFCGAQPVRGCPTVGFSTTVDLNAFNITPGTHTLQIRATNTRGGWRDYPDQPVSINIAAGQSRLPTGAIEAPANGATISGTFALRGYAFAPDVRISAVDILVDGITYGQATYGQRRDDICGTQAAGAANCPFVGFTFNLNSTTGSVPLPNGTHLIQAQVRDEAGRVTLIPSTPVSITVRNETSLAPTGVLLNPAPNSTLSGTVKIWGWAWDPDGTIRSARLLVDGVSYLTLTYGEERAAQCATLPDVRACPNIGFWGDFNTRLVPNGLHTIGVLLTDDRGKTTIIPGLNALGMDVVFRN